MANSTRARAVPTPARPVYELDLTGDQLPGSGDENDVGCWVLPDEWGWDLEVGDRVAISWTGSRSTTAASVVGHHNHTGAAVVRPDAVSVILGGGV